MEESLTPNQSEFLLYTTQNGAVKVDVLLQDETVWLTQKALQVLFGKDKRTISEHIGNVFSEGEVERESTVRNFRTVQQEGSRQVARNLEYYNLDVIISVG